ncbi:hypothetical protein HYPSUDRAFT_852873 [Hypholoma sublateritium FD-334 SS-4]|uniref:DUF3295 domain-containing protein n=1 Tax=Hypholoma sublateritium (strain FD-334 SS-4) TaxID=945553 RepID=A0A0D2PIL0_HYPSF|nr:hypothetical protein HYPSUDRAFT_852873 [Hypholoma sublateritium FD-334 SS-4]
MRSSSATSSSGEKGREPDTEKEKDGDIDVEPAEDDNQDLVAEAGDERARERYFAQEQVHRAARAEEEKLRRSDAERQQRQLETAAALNAPTADNACETSSMWHARFNIGSHSDDGAGSGSDPSAAVQAGAGANGKGKERAMEGAVDQQNDAQQNYGQQAQQLSQLPQIPPTVYPQQQEAHAQLPSAAALSQSQMRQLERLHQVPQYHVGAPQLPITEEENYAAFGLASAIIEEGKQREVSSAVAADDGEWSSEGLTADDEEPQAQRQAQQEAEEEEQRGLQLQRQLQQLGQRQQPTRPPAVRRTHSSHYPGPAANDARDKQEARRQRELFVKLPTKSFQDLAKTRSESVVGLTQLLNPNPELSPVNHPHRRNLSSGEIRRGGDPTVSPMQSLMPTIPSQSPPAPPPTSPVPASRGAVSVVPVTAIISPSIHHPAKRAGATSIRSARQNMLSTEISESLRRHLLWQRQTSKPNPTAIRKTANAGSSRLDPLGGEQAVLPSMAQVHPQGKPEGTPQVTAQKPVAATQQERDEGSDAGISRNVRYTDDYHYTGW